MGGGIRLRRLQDPEPVDVRWVAADPRLADHPENVRRIPAPRDGERQLGGIVDAFAAAPGRRLVVLGGPVPARACWPCGSPWAGWPSGDPAARCR
ncbi:hypothetical protein [Streptomyces chartreusis]|uniref:hypothetical protein n=1 Tax=Streptomyces chartreusis TaxID=1969 RepID=UPI0037BB7F6A